MLAVCRKYPSNTSPWICNMKAVIRRKLPNGYFINYFQERESEQSTCCPDSNHVPICYLVPLSEASLTQGKAPPCGFSWLACYFGLRGCATQHTSYPHAWHSRAGRR